MKQVRIFLLLIFSMSATAHYYSPTISLGMKVGNTRDISRLGMLVPLVDSESKVLYFHSFGMLDSKLNTEGNYALGYRYFTGKHIIGGYLYYDRRHASNQLVHQITPGVELLSESLEYRINGYFPTNGAMPVENESILVIDKVYSNIYVENSASRLVPMGGFDVEVGYKNQANPLKLYLAYYYFNDNKVNSIHGPRLRAYFSVYKNLQLTAEVQYDRVRDYNYFAGFNLHYTFDKKSNRHWSYSKMTQLPERDIDVVTDNEILNERITLLNDTLEKEIEVVEIESYAKLKEIGVDAEKSQSKKVYVVTKDIVAPPKSFHVPIGNKDKPFEGIFFGGEKKSNFRYKLQTRQIKLDNVKAKHKNIGLFGMVDYASISHIAVKHAFKIDSSNKSIGAIAGLANYSYFSHVANLSNIKIEGDHVVVGGIVGTNSENNIIEFSYNIGKITIGGHYNKIGGIVGVNQRNNTIKYCKNTGMIEALGHYLNAGGIFGESGTNNTIIFNFNEGFIIVSSRSNVGGIGAFAEKNNTIMHCINREIIKSNKNNKMGGILGSLSEANKIQYNYNRGELEGYAQSSIGGIVGEVKQGVGSNVLSLNYNVGPIFLSGGRGFAGGIIGQALSMDNDISYNYNLADIKLINSTELPEITKAGGIIGHLGDKNSVSFCFNKGKIDLSNFKKFSNMSKSSAGAIIGSCGNYNIINNNYNTGDIDSYNIATGHIGSIVGIIGSNNNIYKNINSGSIKEKVPDISNIDMNIGAIIGTLGGSNNTVERNYNYADTIVTPNVYNKTGNVGIFIGKQGDSKEKNVVVNNYSLGKIIVDKNELTQNNFMHDTINNLKTNVWHNKKRKTLNPFYGYKNYSLINLIVFSNVFLNKDGKSYSWDSRIKLINDNLYNRWEASARGYENKPEQHDSFPLLTQPRIRNLAFQYTHPYIPNMRTIYGLILSNKHNSVLLKINDIRLELLKMLFPGYTVKHLNYVLSPHSKH